MGISGDIEWLRENDPERRLDWYEYMITRTGSYLGDALLAAGYECREHRQGLLVWRTSNPTDTRYKIIKHDKHLERFLKKLIRDSDYFDSLGQAATNVATHQRR